MKLYAFLLLACCAAPAAEGAQLKQNGQQTERNTKLQIFLDNADFGPGKIDGQEGEFTKKALALYRQAKGLPAAPQTNSKAPIDTSGLDLSSIDPVFTTYTITAEDAANVGELPKGPEAQARVKRLPYPSLAEDLAEKFHCSLSYFKKLNPQNAGKLKVGDQIKVPNVKPFEVSAIKGLEPGTEASKVIANELGEDKPATGNSRPAPSAEDKKLSIHADVKDNMLEVLAEGKVVAAFPTTVGSQQTASPIGHWVVKSIAKWPNFRYDPLMLKKGERGSNFHLLPPGPRNPVGVIWIALNKKGIGIHGTDNPDSIGRNASHGCIRLANWDIVKLAAMVKPGAPVAVDDAAPTGPAAASSK